MGFSHALLFAPTSYPPKTSCIEVSNEGAKMPYGFCLNDNLIHGSTVEVTRKPSKETKEKPKS